MAKEMLALYGADNLPHLLVKDGGERPYIHCARCGLQWEPGQNYQAIEGYDWVSEEDKDPYSSQSPEFSYVHLSGVQIWDPCKPRDWYVNKYEMHQQYGGPEEGGHWFDKWYAEDWVKVQTYGYGQMLRDALYENYEEPKWRRWSTQYNGGEYDFRLEEFEAVDGDNYRPYC